MKDGGQRSSNFQFATRKKTIKNGKSIFERTNSKVLFEYKSKKTNNFSNNDLNKIILNFLTLIKELLMDFN